MTVSYEIATSASARFTIGPMITDSCQLPNFNLAQAAQFARQVYAIEGTVKLLDGERDLNVLIEASGAKFILKIANQTESPAMLACQHQVFDLLHTAKALPQVAIAVPSVNGQLVEMLASPQTEHAPVKPTTVQHACRLLPFIEGRMLADLDSFPASLLEDLGQRLALLDQALKDYNHPALQRPLLWNMDQACEIVEVFKPLLADQQQTSLVEFFQQRFIQQVLPKQDQLRRSVIHNDANRGNVVIDSEKDQVLSIIDFGDMINGWLVNEPAIAASYVMLDQKDPIGNAQKLLHGYHQIMPLRPVEIGAVFDLICMRLCMSVCICAHQQQLEPDNQYLSVDQQAAWQLLSHLRELDYHQVQAGLLEACT